MILNPGPHQERPLADLLGREQAAGAPLCGMAWLSGVLAVAAGDGIIRLFEPSLMLRDEIKAHSGAILSVSVAPRNSMLVTGGDDGRVGRLQPDRGFEIVHETGGRWIDHVAAGRDGALSWSEGRKAIVITKSGIRHELQHPSTVGGLAFCPTDDRIGVAHYNGATIWSLEGAAPKDRTLAWKGSHVGISWSPNARFLVTVMQENALHGWRLSDAGNMRMSGYPGRPRSLSFSSNGLWLATSGAEGAVLWPFKGKDGPMGKSGAIIGQRPCLASAVAWHPGRDVLAAGYADGAVFLIRRNDDRMTLVRRPRLDDAVAAVAWAVDGSRLAYGTTNGVVGVVDVAAAIR